MQYLHSIDWNVVGVIAFAFAAFGGLFWLMRPITEAEREEYSAGPVDNDRIADNAVTDGKIACRIRDGIFIADPNLRCTKLDLTPGAVPERLYLINEDYRRLHGAPPTEEELYDEWQRDARDCAMDLDRLAKKWRGRVPKNPDKELLSVLEQYQRERDEMWSPTHGYAAVLTNIYVASLISEVERENDPLWRVIQSQPGDEIVLANPNYAPRKVSIKETVKRSAPLDIESGGRIRSDA